MKTHNTKLKPKGTEKINIMEKKNLKKLTGCQTMQGVLNNFSKLKEEKRKRKMKQYLTFLQCT